MGRGQHAQALEEAVVGADGGRYRRARRKAATPLEMPKAIEPVRIDLVTTTEDTNRLYEWRSGNHNELRINITQRLDEKTKSSYWAVDDSRFAGQRFDSYDDGRKALGDVLIKTPFGGAFYAVGMFGQGILASGALSGWMTFRLRPEITFEADGDQTRVAIEGIPVGSVRTADLSRPQGWERAGLDVGYAFVADRTRKTVQLEASVDLRDV